MSRISRSYIYHLCKTGIYIGSYRICQRILHAAIHDSNLIEFLLGHTDDRPEM
jgi:hypothetical protein